jgi:hypothetical protein
MGYIGIHCYIGYIGIHRSQRKVIGRLKPFHIEHSDPHVPMYPDVSRCIHRCIPMYLVKKVSKNKKLHSLILMYADVSSKNTLAYIGGYIVLYLAIFFHYLFDEMASTYFKCVIGIHRHTSVRDSCYWLEICKNTSGYIGIHRDTSIDVSVQFPPVVRSRCAWSAANSAAGNRWTLFTASAAHAATDGAPLQVGMLQWEIPWRSLEPWEIASTAARFWRRQWACHVRHHWPRYSSSAMSYRSR